MSNSYALSGQFTVRAASNEAATKPGKKYRSVKQAGSVADSVSEEQARKAVLKRRVFIKSLF